MTPLERQYRQTLDRLHDSMAELRGYQVAYGVDREVQLLQVLVSVALVAALEATEANCRRVLTDADWSSVLAFYSKP